MLSEVIYNSFKYAVKSLWKKLITLYNHPKDNQGQDEHLATIKINIFAIGDIEFELTNIKASQVNDVVDKSFEYLSNKRQRDQDLRNPDFIESNRGKDHNPHLQYSVTPGAGKEKEGDRIVVVLSGGSGAPPLQCRHEGPSQSRC